MVVNLLYCYLVDKLFKMYFGFNVAGAGSTPLHYAACGGNVVCFQVCPAQKFVSSQIRDGQSKLTG